MSIFLCLHPWPQGPRAVRDKGVTQNYLVEAKAEKAPSRHRSPRTHPSQTGLLSPAVTVSSGEVTSGLVRVSHSGKQFRQRLGPHDGAYCGI